MCVFNKAKAKFRSEDRYFNKKEPSVFSEEICCCLRLYWDIQIFSPHVWVWLSALWRRDFLGHDAPQHESGLYNTFLSVVSVCVWKICIVFLWRVKRSGLKDSLGRRSVQQHWLNTSAICSSFYVGWNAVEVAHISHHAAHNLGVAYYDVSRFFFFFFHPLHLHPHF